MVFVVVVKVGGGVILVFVRGWGHDDLLSSPTANCTSGDSLKLDTSGVIV